MNVGVKMIGAALLGASLCTAGVVSAKPPVLLTEEEMVTGWELLFDGESLAGIHSWKTKGPLPADGAWQVDKAEGSLKLTKAGGGDIYFPRVAENFELELEWKSEGNSGIFLRVDPQGSGEIWKNALEMQIMNDTNEDDGVHAGGALYDIIPLYYGNKKINTDGWNKVRISCRNNEFTHWLNGEKCYSYTVGGEHWLEWYMPKTKFKDNPNFGTFIKGSIGLQDHGDKVAFRNIKLRELKGEDAISDNKKHLDKVFQQHGPVVASVFAGYDDVYDVNRGFVVNLLKKSTDVGVVFNADTMQLAGGWTDGGDIGFHGLPFQDGHGATPAWTEKKALFCAKNQPGWASPEGMFDDPRAAGEPPLGGVDAAWMKFRGHYVNGNEVVFSYRVAEVEVLDRPDAFVVDGQPVIVRQLAFSGLENKKALYLADVRGAVEVNEIGDEAIIAGTRFKVRGSAMLSLADGRLLLTVPADRGDKTVVLTMDRMVADTPAHEVAISRLAEPATLTKGGVSRFKTEQPIVTKGKLAKGDAAYVVDRLTLPHENPFGKDMRVGAFDFFSDGESLAFCTWDGDLWKVSGIDERLDRLEYKLIGTGLHEPLGLTIVDDIIYTVGNDQVTKHHDLNGDGEIDFYQCFNNDWPINKGFHVFTFDLKTDKQGNFWFAQGSPVRGGGRGFERIAQLNGSVLKLSPDGSKLEQIASGLRAPNGIGVGPNGEITASDNEGSYMPRCPIHWITAGYFGGVVDTYAQREQLKSAPWEDENHALDPSEMPKPMVWLPREVDNSGGSQVWVEGDRWGMPAGQMLHCSYGTSTLYRAFYQQVNGVVQGGVTKIPLQLTSSAMRARFNKADGQLYIGGLRGWQTNAAKLGGIDRIRYTGKPQHALTAVEASTTGLTLRFNFKLDDELAEDLESYALKAANIKWSHEYGSLEHKLDGSGEGWTKFEVTGAKLLGDGQSVQLTVEGMRPAHEWVIDLDLETTEGDEVIFPAWFTIHTLAK